MTAPNPLTKQRPITEKEMQQVLEEALTYLGYEWYHDRALAYARVKANRPGFPDLVACHKTTGALFFLELKTKKGRLTKPQEAWGRVLEMSPAHYQVVRPDDLDDVIDTLRKEGTP